MSTRPYVVSFLRDKGAVTFKAPRYFSRLDTAVPRGVAILLCEGQPGDVVEVASNDFGFQIATIKVHAGGRLTIALSPHLKE